MSLLAKPIKQITEEDLQSLVTSSVPESQILDYKQTTVGNSDKDRYEFLADVSSFANSSGGEILFGLAEMNGAPSQVCGLKLTNADQEILRLEQIARTGIRPPIQGIETRAIPLNGGDCVLLMRIPKSWSSPHQVGQQGSFRFFGRGSNGKFQLDVDSLRALFRQGPEVTEQIRAFRAERLGRIASDELPAAMPPGSRTIVHIVPIENFCTNTAVDLTPVRQNHGLLIAPLNSGGSVRANLEGQIAVSHRHDETAAAYVQLFRHGALEIVKYEMPWEVRGHNFLPGLAFDEAIQEILSGTKRLYAAIDVLPPLVVMLTLLNMEDRLMGAGKQYGYERDRPFGRKEIACPDVLIDDLTKDERTLAFPIVNLAWNAAGYEQSVFYDKNGNWKAKPS
jgi:Putative DNA-binding domain